uniref:Transmembrane protein n=1 Tax=Medicago truncatula TaxID=3880 RepID=I3SBZ1_MEDTR|nr:unknown [Medicago truncatula]
MHLTISTRNRHFITLFHSTIITSFTNTRPTNRTTRNRCTRIHSTLTKTRTTRTYNIRIRNLLCRHRIILTIRIRHTRVRPSCCILLIPTTILINLLPNLQPFFLKFIVLSN